MTVAEAINTQPQTLSKMPRYCPWAGKRMLLRNGCITERCRIVEGSDLEYWYLTEVNGKTHKWDFNGICKTDVLPEWDDFNMRDPKYNGFKGPYDCIGIIQE